MKTQMEEKQQIIQAYELVSKYFNNDLYKTNLWFESDNALLGHISPISMIKIGRVNKLLKIIQNALDGNIP